MSVGEFDEGCVGADDFVGRNEDAFDYAVFFGSDVVFHLHSLVDEEDVAGFDSLTVLDVDLDDASAHRSSEHLAGDGFDRFSGLSLFFGFFGSRGGIAGLIFFGAAATEESVGYGGKELQEEIFLIVGGELHAAEIVEYGSLGLTIGVDIIGMLGGIAGDLLTESGVDGHGGVAVFAFDQRDKLIGSVGIVGIAFLTVEGEADSLAADDLAGRGDERNQTGIATHFRDKAHGIVEELGSLELFELSDHVGVHTAGDFGILDKFVGLGEAEIFLDGVTRRRAGLVRRKPWRRR